MVKERYGAYSAKDYEAVILGSFGDQSTGSDELILERFRWGYTTPEARAEFREAFREFILDDSMTFVEKARKYLEEAMEEEGARYFFQDCWELLFPDHPWPLDEPAAKPK